MLGIWPGQCKNLRFLAILWGTLIAGWLCGLGILAPGEILATEPETLKLISFNVWNGFQVQPERKADWFRWVKQQEPQLVALQELQTYTADRLAEEAQQWGHAHTVLLKETGFPTGLSSSAPITEVRRAVEGFHHGLLRCQTHGLTVFVVHLHPSNWEIRHREVGLLLEEIKSLPPEARVVLIGDFNTFSPVDKAAYEQSPDLIPFFQRLDQRESGKNLREGQLDYTHMERFSQAGLIDLVAALRTEFAGTFPAGQRADEDVGPSRRLDYLLVSPNLREACVQAEVVADQETNMLSDHYPLRAVLRKSW